MKTALNNPEITEAPGLRLYCNQAGDLFLFEEKPKQGDWRLVPKTVGIIWHDDQSQNQMVFNHLGQADYIFRPHEDLALALEFSDDIANYMFQ